MTNQNPTAPTIGDDPTLSAGIKLVSEDDYANVINKLRLGVKRLEKRYEEIFGHPLPPLKQESTPANSR